MGVRLPGRAGPGKLAKMSALAPPIAPVDLLGVPVHPLTLAEAVAHLAEAIARRRPTTVVSLNGALLMRVLRDPQVRDAVRGAAPRPGLPAGRGTRRGRRCGGPITAALPRPRSGRHRARVLPAGGRTGAARAHPPGR